MGVDTNMKAFTQTKAGSGRINQHKSESTSIKINQKENQRLCDDENE